MEQSIGGACTAQVANDHSLMNGLVDELVLRFRVDGIDQQVNEVRQASHYAIVVLLLSPENWTQEQQMLNYNGAFRQSSKYSQDVFEPRQNIVLMHEPGPGIASYVAGVLNMQIQHQAHQCLGRKACLEVQNGPVGDANLEQKTPQIDATLQLK